MVISSSPIHLRLVLAPRAISLQDIRQGLGRIPWPLVQVHPTLDMRRVAMAKAAHIILMLIHMDCLLAQARQYTIK